MKTTNQNYTTSPRSKRRGLIRLGLLCLLSAIVAPFQSFAQQVPTVDPTNLNFPASSFTSGVRRIRTDIDEKPVAPSKAKNGSVFTFSGHWWLYSGLNRPPLANQMVIIRVGGINAKPVTVRTDAFGNFKTQIRLLAPADAFTAGRSDRVFFVVYEYLGTTVYAGRRITRTVQLLK